MRAKRDYGTTEYGLRIINWRLEVSSSRCFPWFIIRAIRVIRGTIRTAVFQTVTALDFAVFAQGPLRILRQALVFEASTSPAICVHLGSSVV